MPDIRFDQGDTGTVNRERTDIAIDTELDVVALNVVGTAVFGLLDKPEGATATFSGTGNDRQITPDKAGAYRCRIVDDADGSSVIHTFKVRTANRNLAFPAHNERANLFANAVDTDPGTWVNDSESNEGGHFEGWHPEMIEILEAIDFGGGDHGPIIVAYGRNALADLTSGTGNIAIGEDSLAAVTTGNNNTAIGYCALSTGTTFIENTAIGAFALFDSTADGCSAFGGNALGYNTTGSGNNAFGLGALLYNEDGENNCAFGNFAIRENTSGSYNVGIGVNCLYYPATSEKNTAIGYQAGYGSLGGHSNSNNVFIGYQSGFAVTTGDDNVLAGKSAGGNITTGSGNIIIGADIDASSAAVSNELNIGNDIFISSDGGQTILGRGAGNLGTSSADFTAIGENALAALTTGVDNTAIGENALAAISTSSYCVAVGVDALLNNTTGANTAVGFEALETNTTGGYMVAIGYRALRDNTIGSYNTAVGRQALESNTEGVRNTAVGYAALQSSETAVNNVGIGYSALKSATGGNNVAIGAFTLEDNTTGAYNMAQGAGALGNNTTGSNNVSIGRQSMLYCNPGENNTVIGTQAGYGTTGVSAFDNSVLIGYRAGYALTDGDDNILIGYQAGDNITSGARNILIGDDIDASSATVNDELNIGDILKGDLSTGDIAIGMDVNTAIRLAIQIAASQSVGIRIQGSPTSTVIYNEILNTLAGSTANRVGLRWYVRDSLNVNTLAARVKAGLSTITDGSEVGITQLAMMVDGTLTEDVVLIENGRVRLDYGLLLNDHASAAGAGGDPPSGYALLWPDNTVDPVRLMMTTADSVDHEVSAYPPNYIDGLAISNGTDAAHEVDIATGACRDVDDSLNIKVTATLTADIEVSGANGLDTGTVAANTFYSVWVISKLDGTKAALLSTSQTSPTMPSGYTKKRRVGWCRTDASSNIYTITQSGAGRTRRIMWDQLETATLLVLSAGSSTSWAEIVNAGNGIDDWAPPGTKQVYLHIYGVTDNEHVSIRPLGSSVNNPAFKAYGGQTGVTTRVRGSTWGFVPCNADRKCQYKWSATTGEDAYIWMLGYEDEL